MAAPPDVGSSSERQPLLAALRLSTAATIAGAMITTRGKPTSIAEALRVTKSVEEALYARRPRIGVTLVPNEYDATPGLLGTDETYE